MNTARIVIGLVVIGFLAGMVGGYAIWRPKDDGKADIRELLAKVGDAADRIEKRNKDLVSQVEALRGNAMEAEALKAENLTLKGQLDNIVQETNRLTASLDNEIRSLNDRVKQKQREIAEKESLHDQRQSQLQEELSTARQEAQRGEKFKELSEDLQSRVAALERENAELKSVIDNISEITKRKEVPR